MKKLIVLICLLNPITLMADSPGRMTVNVDGHPFVIWHKVVADEKARVLLLHGRTWSSLPNFDLQVEGERVSFMDLLNEQGISVFAMDARGYGATPRDESGWLTPDRATRDVIGVLRQFDEPMHLFGWSYGAMVGQLVAQRHPQLIRSLTLFGYPYDPKRHVVSELHQYPEQPLNEPTNAVMARSDFILKDAISPAVVQAYVRATLTHDPIRVDFKNLHEWVELETVLIESPLLLIHGERDPLALTRIHEQVFRQSHHPMKRWVILPGGAHAALLETPRFQMVEALADFMMAVQALE